jgi:uncharacterized protein (TIGR04222 family)
MNPFDLPGPAFLVFYWVLSIASLLVVYWFHVSSDVTDAAQHLQADPYIIAYLRAGHPEVVRVALLVLIDEGVVAVDERNLTLAAEPGRKAPKIASRRIPVENELIKFLTGRRYTDLDQIAAANVGKDACVAYQSALEESGHLRRSSDLNKAQLAAALAALVLPVVALIKMVVAFSRGKTNVGFLILSAITTLVIALALGAGLERITTRGKNALQATAALLGGARGRLMGASNAMAGPELALLAAAYGFSLFESNAARFAFWPALVYPRERAPTQRLWTSSDSSSSSSCSSTTFSSCGGGGGSSCGGGGCGGGGCGGCGGE